MSKIIVRQYGVDDMSMDAPDYLIGKQYINFTVTTWPTFVTKADLPVEPERNTVELSFAGYEEFGRETLPIYRVV